MRTLLDSWLHSYIDGSHGIYSFFMTGLIYGHAGMSICCTAAEDDVCDAGDVSEHHPRLHLPIHASNVYWDDRWMHWENEDIFTFNSWIWIDEPIKCKKDVQLF